MKKILFSLLALSAVSFTHTKDSDMARTPKRAVVPPSEMVSHLATPVPMMLATKNTTMPTGIQIPPFSEWVNITQTQMENIKPEDIIAKLSEVLEIKERLATEHLQLILNIIIHAMHRDPKLFKEVIHPMIVSLGQKMFTNAPQYSPRTLVSLTTVR